MTMALTASLLRVECTTTSALALPEFTGSALRGALLGALRRLFCPAPAGTDCAPCPFSGICPLSRLIATRASAAGRGEEAPRPYVLRPVQAQSRALETGESFSFGVTLIGDALTAFPYLLQGLQAMGEAGFGLRSALGGRPGSFVVQRIVALNPAIAAQQTVYEKDRAAVYAPMLPVDHQQITMASGLMSRDQLTLELRSPLRLVTRGALVHELRMAVLMQRLLRRLTDLCAHFSPSPLETDFAGLLQSASGVQTVEDKTHWVDLESFSGRSGRRTPIGGLMGQLRFAGDLAPLLPYLGWLPVVGAGKDTTKGNGWIELT